MAGRVKAATAYIDIKLGSFQEFKQAAEARARETAKSVAKKMTDEITKGVSGKAAGTKIGTEAVNEGTKQMGRLRSLWNNESVAAARSASSQFAKTFGLGIQAAGLGDFKFLSAAARSLGSQISSGVQSGLKSLPGVFKAVGNAGVAAFNGIKSAYNTISGLGSKAAAGLSRISSAFETIGRKVGFASFMLQGLGHDLTFAVTAPALAAAGAFSYFGIKAGLDLEQARHSLAPFVGGLKNAQKEIEVLAKIAADSPAFDTIQIVGYAKSLISAGLTVDKTNKLFMASSNIFTTLGLSVDQANGAFYAITQIMQKGTAQSEELSQQLAERGVPIWKILADSIGVPQAKLKDLVSQGKITSDVFVNAMIKAGMSGVYLNGASTGADTLRAKMASLREQIQFKLGVAFEKYLFPVLNDLADKYGPSAVKFMNNFAEVQLPKAAARVKELAGEFDALKGKWDGLSESTKENVKQFALFLVAAGPTILILTRIGSAIGAVATAIALLSTPVGIVVAVIALLAAALYSVREPISAWLSGTEDGRKAAQQFKDGLKAIVDFWDKYLNPILIGMKKAVQDAMIGFVTGKADAEGLEGAFGKLRKTIGEIISDFKEQLKPSIDDFNSAFADLGIKVNLVSVAIDSFKIGLYVLAAIIGLVVAVIVGLVSAVIRLISGLVRVVTDIIVGAYNVVVALTKILISLFTGNWSGFTDTIRQLWDGLWQLIVGTIWDAVATIIDVVVALVKPIIKWFKYLYDVIVGHSIVPDLVNAIISWFSQLPGRVVGMISGMVSSVISYFVNMYNGAVNSVKNLASAVGDRIRGVASTVVSAASNFGSLLVNSGREIIEGLISGIASKVGALKDKLSGVASTIAGFFPGSPVKTGPLKVLNNGHVGATIVQMIADGMGNTRPLVSASAGAAGAISTGLTVGVTPSALVGNFEAGGHAEAGIVINQTNNIPAPIQDPAEFGEYSTRRIVSALTTKASS